ncbi:MAG: carboxymuconolactone decarboxylase family protein [Acidimicrobiales bacterium]
MRSLSARSAGSGLPPLLAELIKIRASQLNGCAYCLDMHTKDARALGETEQRIYALDAWRETSFYSDAERATLAFTEAVTVLDHGEIPDHLFEALRQHFDEAVVGKILLAVVVINAWNRLMIAQRPAVGGYVSPHRPHA